MVRITSNVVLSLVFMAVGAVGGYAVRDWFCADQNGAIIKQLEEDNRKLAKAKAQIKVKEVIREKIKTVVKAVPVDAECLDNDYPAAIISGMCQSLDPTRPEADGTCEEIASPENPERVRDNVH